MRDWDLGSAKAKIDSLLFLSIPDVSFQYNQIMECFPSLIMESVELQRFKFGASAFLLGVDGL